jgi:hypothetical protein
LITVEKISCPDGAEQSIIAGMSETVRKRKLTSVAIEVSDQSEPANTEFLEKAGFKIEFERRFRDEEATYKNIIFARK